MALRFRGPRKQRTRQHVIADQSIHYVEGFVLDEGHTCERIERDYGYDLFMFTYDEKGYLEPGMVMFQVKASDSLKSIGSDYVFDVDVRDHGLWTLEKAPVILVLYDAILRHGFWLYIQHYFQEAPSRGPRTGARSVRVKVPMRQKITRKTIARVRRLKWTPQLRVVGDES